ncbi:beta-galactosidase [Filimonas effusa]|uniref:Beta-galactosidase n=1 Tax=Filimonas effusa TaxID=2508721 RepID=A0A4Q1DDJ3_9BACT|nr:beta-galactosidase [Filimonas effusa]RXK86639.1 hypothetical protein ESB13_07495 [Filimonas effusa]
MNIRCLPLVLLYVICCWKVTGQRVFTIDASVQASGMDTGSLRMGGEGPDGAVIRVNSAFLEMNGAPVVPVTGEFHFSRYAEQYWDESIRKIKAGGVSMIATYVFWNFHEEKEGVFRWDGDRNLRKFITLCRQNNMPVIVRIGPFCHGEVRNGGMPDWLLGRPCNVRSNDAAYLAYVERFYKEIGKQLSGLYFKDGGPVVGIQIENEYQHSAAPWGLTYLGQPREMTVADRDMAVTQEGVGISREKNPFAELGNDHMRVLKALAVKAGMVVPFYTATGWGNAAIIPGESIPVTAAYAYPFWTPKRDYSPFFLYKDMRRVPDYAPVRYNPASYPVFAAELGSGIASVYSRRPVAVHKSFDAMINRCLGSGANGVGYYMYHGGSTPRGELGFLSDEAYALPKISYDFQAPIGEYGQVREGFHRLKLIHFFLRDFGHLLAPMHTVLPDNAGQLKPENISDLRYAVRVKDNAGFVFLNNFQDDTTMADQRNFRIDIKARDKHIVIPESGGLDMKSGENMILPFNFDMGGVRLNYATAQLLAGDTKAAVPYYVFFTQDSARGAFSFAGNIQVKNKKAVTVNKAAGSTLVNCRERVAAFTIASAHGDRNILVIDKSLALQSYVVTIGEKRHLFFSDAVVLQEGNQLDLLIDSLPVCGFHIYPRIAALPGITTGKLEKAADDGVFTSYRVNLPSQRFPLTIKELSSKKWAIGFPAAMPEGVNDVLVDVDYTGDTGMGFVGGELVADNFYNGLPWQIGMRNLLGRSSGEMVLYLRPMQENASYLVDLEPVPGAIPEFGAAKRFLKVNNIHTTIQYKTTLKF